MYKMLEALKSEEVDVQIAKLSKKIEAMPDESLSESFAKPDFHVNDKEEEISAPQAEATEKANAGQSVAEKFRLLKEKIYDRDPRLGECFENSVELIGYEEGILSWMSCADEECKKQLRTYWSVIRHFVQEVFGIDVKIESAPCSRSDALSEEDKKKTAEPIEEPSEEESDECSSMIEAVELGDAGSCMQNNSGLGDAAKEYNGADILNEPFVKKAIELFEAQRIRIRPKI